jgi:hypothetical protein
MLATVSMIGLFACGGDDDAAPKNQIKVNNNTFKFSGAHMQSTLNLENEAGQFSLHTFFLHGGGLLIDEDGDFSGTGEYLEFTLISKNTTSLEEGTYELKLNTDIGDALEFFIYSNLGPDSYDEYYEGYSGTIKVSKSGDKYTLTFNLDVYTIETEDENPEFGNGTLKGNYKGSVVVIEEEEGSRKSFESSDKRKFMQGYEK